MTETSTTTEAAAGPTYYIDLEGIGIKEWHSDSITVPQIRGLAGWDASQPVLEVNLQDNTEVTLAEDAVVKLKPGQGFAKKVKFKRG